MSKHEPASSLPVWLALLLFLTPITAQRPREKAPTCVVTYSVSQWGFAGWTGQRLTVYAPGTAVLDHFMGQSSEGKEAGRTIVTPDEMKRLATAIRDAGYAGSEVRFADDRVVNRGKAALTFCPVDNRNEEAQAHKPAISFKPTQTGETVDGEIPARAKVEATSLGVKPRPPASDPDLC